MRLRDLDNLETKALGALKRVGLLLAGNTLAALLLALSGFSGGFPKIWIFSQVLGCSIGLGCVALGSVWKSGRPWIVFPLGVLLGLGIGKSVIALLGIPGIGGYILGNREAGLRLTGLAFLFSAAFAYFLHNRKRMEALEAARRRAELARAQQENAALAARLHMLQAQVEPHFLFNTLANVHSLIGSDPTLARSLLERLDEYLRASLTHNRTGTRTLGEECALLEAYLGIQAFRMGRLAWVLDVAEPLRALPLPPMLLQPLVENAVIHGIEPKIGPGRIEIRAVGTEHALHVTVRDDGAGMTSEEQGGGTGLANVRERLRAIYGAEAGLQVRSVEPDQGSGVVAELWIPAHPAP